MMRTPGAAASALCGANFLPGARRMQTTADSAVGERVFRTASAAMGASPLPNGLNSRRTAGLRAGNRFHQWNSFSVLCSESSRESADPTTADADTSPGERLDVTKICAAAEAFEYSAYRRGTRIARRHGHVDKTSRSAPNRCCCTYPRLANLWHGRGGRAGRLQ